VSDEGVGEKEWSDVLGLDSLSAKEPWRLNWTGSCGLDGGWEGNVGCGGLVGTDGAKGLFELFMYLNR
jgi:hypothetical protein